MSSRSEYIGLIVSRLGLPGEYDYWPAEYSPNFSQKSITTAVVDTLTLNCREWFGERLERRRSTQSTGLLCPLGEI